MPLYEYECDACGHRFEVIQKFSDALIDVCPVCGGVVTKLFSSPAIQFKGSGWYITDYARAGKGDSGGTSAGTSGPSSESTASTESAQGISESKADARSDAKKRESSPDTRSESKSAKTDSPAPTSAPAKTSS